MALCSRLGLLVAVWGGLLLGCTVRQCDGARIVVEARGHAGDGWTVSGVGCRAPTGGADSCQPVQYADIYAHVGDTLLFRYAWFHDVFLSNLSEKNCDFTNGQVIAGASDGGGDGFQYLLTEVGTFVFSCTRSGNRPGWAAIGSHCASGQVVKVVVAEPSSTDDPVVVDSSTLRGFVGPFEGMGITGFNDLGHAPAHGPAECAARCADLAACHSFDWGARDGVRGECWLSTANRASAGDAYSQWPLYDYYEKSPAVHTPAHLSTSSADDNLMTDEVTSSDETPEGFVGPFEGMGITGFNDLGHAPAYGPAECAARCADLAACRSFDWGARDGVRGECWLSTANRASAGDAYSQWPLYDYYEKSPAVHTPAHSSTSSADDHLTQPSTSTTNGMPSTQTLEHNKVALRIPLVVAGLAVALMCGLCTGCICRRRYRAQSCDEDTSSSTLSMIVQAAPVLPLPIRGEVVSLCPVPALGTSPTVVAEEVKGDYFAEVTISDSGCNALGRRCSV